MFKGQRRFIRKHIVTFSIILFGVLTSTVGLYLQYNHTLAETNRMQASIGSFVASTYKQIALTNRANQEAAAQAAANQSNKVITQTTNTTPVATCNAASTHNNPNNIDILVNKKHCLQPLAFAPSDLVSVEGSFLLSAKAAPSFNAMSAAAAAAGQGFQITSSYRSYSTQVTTYKYWVSISGQAGADTYSARPGYSEHQTGLAVDLQANLNGKTCALSCFLNTSQYTWLQTHAADYGFIQRYPTGQEAITGYESEEWHYRYVGVDVAKNMKAKNVTTLEQYWGISGGDY